MKVEQIRNQMKESPYEPTALLLSALDETACKYFCSFVHEAVQTCLMVNISVYAVEEKKTLQGQWTECSNMFEK